MELKISCFIMNPPYNGNDGIHKEGNLCLGGAGANICKYIMLKLHHQRVVCISNYAGMGGLITKLTSIEKVSFPGILCSTWIWTMNDKKKILFPIIHSLKSVKKSDYFFLKMGNGLLYQIRKTNISEFNRTYVDIKNDEEMNEINKYIRDNWEKYSIFVPTMTWHSWIIANILYNSPWRERFVK